MNKIVKFSNPNFKFNNLIHVKNLSEIIHKILTKEKKNRIYNLGNKYPMKLQQVINHLFMKFKKKKKYEIIKSQNKPFKIKLNKSFLKKYRIFSVKKSLDMFFNENNL